MDESCAINIQGGPAGLSALISLGESRKSIFSNMIFIIAIKILLIGFYTFTGPDHG